MAEKQNSTGAVPSPTGMVPNPKVMVPKYYIVWRGRQPGVYETWPECFAQINGFPGASYRAVDTRELAEEAFQLERPEFEARYPQLKHTPRERSDAPVGVAQSREAGSKPRRSPRPRTPIAGRPDPDSYAVDAACSGNPGPLEYRCVHVGTGDEVFKQGPFAKGTNNVGEFLAIVHALALFKKRGMKTTIYSDSVSAIAWVRRKTCRTRLARDEENAPLFDLIARAETWLRNNEYDSRVLKWDTGVWGENPADFGRKS